MLAETIPESEFGYPNSVLAKTAPFFFCRLQGLSLPQCFAGRYCRLVRCVRHFSLAEVSSSCLLIQLARCSYSIANHPGDLLSIRVFTLRDCCAIITTIENYTFCCRLLNVSNLCFRFVWRMDIICFRNSYCRIGGAKNERTY